MAFEENKHPRDKNGQFTSKGGGASTGSTKTSTPKQKVEYDEDYERSWGSASTKGDPKKLLKSIGKLIESGDDAEANELVEKLENSLPFKDEKEHKEWLDVLFSYSDFRDFENATNKVINNANSGIEEIEIDGDYERAMGPAPDPEEFPEDYKKYISDYKKWVKNGESWDGLDGLKEDDAWENWEEWNDYDAGKTHGYATIDDYNRANEIIDELDTINKKWKNDDRELLKTWQNKSLSDKEYNTKNDELYKKTNEKKAILKKELDEITTRADKFKKQYNEKKKAKDEKERKQAYKLFDLPF